MTGENAEQQRSARWTRRQTLAAIVVAAVIGGLGGAAIYAATEGSSSHAMGGTIRGPMHGPPPGPGPNRPASASAPAAPAGVLHSEYVIPDGNGGYVTKLTQTGVVDVLNPSSIVVRSDDGFTQIYTFPSAAPDNSVATNDTVTVEATRTGATVTLNRIVEGPPSPN